MKIISEYSVCRLRINMFSKHLDGYCHWWMLALIYRLLISNKVKMSKSSFAVGSQDCKKQKSQVTSILQNQNFLVLLYIIKCHQVWKCHQISAYKYFSRSLLAYNGVLHALIVVTHCHVDNQGYQGTHNSKAMKRSPRWNVCHSTKGDKLPSNTAKFRTNFIYFRTPLHIVIFF